MHFNLQNRSLCGIWQWIVNKATNIGNTFLNVCNNIKNGFANVGNVIKNVISNVESWFSFEKWKNIAQNAVSGIKNAFTNMKLSFKLPHFTWTTTPAQGWIANVLSALNLPTSLPKLNVNWYKNGGVFDKTSIIGVGEYAGAKSNPEIVAPQSMIYEASIEAIKDSKTNSALLNNSSDTIKKRIELEIDMTSGGVRLGKKILDLVLDANDFYDLGLI